MTAPPQEADEEKKGARPLSGASWVADYWGVMMPEVFLAGGVALASPGWLISLIVDGRLAAALGLAMGVGLSGFVFAAALQRKSKTILHSCVLLLVLTGAGTLWLMER